MINITWNYVCSCGMSIPFFPISEENLETVLSSVLHDPLENCMEGIEDLATSILRTGKLSVQGEAGGTYISSVCIWIGILQVAKSEALK